MVVQDLTHILETQIPHLMNMLPKTSEDMVDEAGHQVRNTQSSLSTSVISRSDSC